MENMEKKQSNFEKMAIRLKLRRSRGQPTVLLLGSKTGGLFRSQSFYDHIEKLSNRTLNTLPHNKRFKECFEILRHELFGETDLHGFMRLSLQNLTVSDAEMCLAELVKRNYFDEIISTNIDDLLEQALIHVELKEQRDYEVIIPGRGELYHEKVFPLRIIKAFGDLSSRVYSIVDRPGHFDRHANLKNLLTYILTKDILMVGLDPIWDNEVLHVLPNTQNMLWFVNEEDFTGNDALSRVVHQQKLWYIKGNEGQYETFIQALHTEICGGEPLSYQFLREILQRLRGISNTQSKILDEIRELRKEIFNLQNEQKQQDYHKEQ